MILGILKEVMNRKGKEVNLAEAHSMFNFLKLRFLSSIAQVLTELIDTQKLQVPLSENVHFIDIPSFGEADEVESFLGARLGIARSKKPAILTKPEIMK